VQGEAMSEIADLELSGKKGAVHCSAEFLHTLCAWEGADLSLSEWKVEKKMFSSGGEGGWGGTYTLGRDGEANAEEDIQAEEILNERHSAWW